MFLPEALVVLACLGTSLAYFKPVARSPPLRNVASGGQDPIQRRQTNRHAISRRTKTSRALQARASPVPGTCGMFPRYRSFIVQTEYPQTPFGYLVPTSQQSGARTYLLTNVPQTQSTQQYYLDDQCALVGTFNGVESVLSVPGSGQQIVRFEPRGTAGNTELQCQVDSNSQLTCSALGSDLFRYQSSTAFLVISPTSGPSNNEAVALYVIDPTTQCARSSLPPGSGDFVIQTSYYDSTDTRSRPRYIEYVPAQGLRTSSLATSAITFSLDSTCGVIAKNAGLLTVTDDNTGSLVKPDASVGPGEIKVTCIAQDLFKNLDCFAGNLGTEAYEQSGALLRLDPASGPTGSDTRVALTAIPLVSCGSIQSYRSFKLISNIPDNDKGVYPFGQGGTGDNSYYALAVDSPDSATYYLDNNCRLSGYADLTYSQPGRGYPAQLRIYSDTSPSRQKISYGDGSDGAYIIPTCTVSASYILTCAANPYTKFQYVLDGNDKFLYLAKANTPGSDVTLTVTF